MKDARGRRQSNEVSSPGDAGLRDRVQDQSGALRAQLQRIRSHKMDQLSWN